MSTHSSETLPPDVEKTNDVKKQRANDTQPPTPPETHEDEEGVPPSTIAPYTLSDDKYRVVLTPDEDPKAFSALRKWTIVLVISSAALCATFASSAVCYFLWSVGFSIHSVF